MKIGTRVIVVSPCHWQGERGVVTQLDPCVMVLLDGERLAMRFDAVVEDSPAEPSMTGAE